MQEKLENILSERIRSPSTTEAATLPASLAT